MPMPSFISVMISICLLGACPEAWGQIQYGLVKDKDGNSYTFKTIAGNKQWITTNLNTRIPGSYCYDHDEQKCEAYGRLYTWKSAQDGCHMLGEGWHLPTEKEWRQMAMQYGGVYEDSQDSGRNAFHALVYEDSTGFKALLGGGMSPDGQFVRLEAHGFYWTATENDSATACYYNFGKGRGMLFSQQGGEKNRAFSVRCARDPGNLKGQ